MNEKFLEATRRLYTFSGACQTCGKKMWERDRVYSQLKFNKVVCRLHSPFGTPPLHERFDLRTAEGREAAREAGMAEGRAVSQLNKLN